MEILDGEDPDADVTKFEYEYRRLAASDVASDAHAGQMMLDLIDRLRRDVVGPRLFGSYKFGELVMHYWVDRDHHSTISVCIDHQDFAPLGDGLPRFHYRLRYGVPPPHSVQNPETVDERTRDVDRACEVIREAIERYKSGM